jgi:DNA phosphorothioation-dependent restriction protein DptG
MPKLKMFLKKISITRWYKKRKLKKQLQLLYNLFISIEELMDVLRYDRHQRRSFFEDFYRHKAFRQEVFDKLIEQRKNAL